MGIPLNLMTWEACLLLLAPGLPLLGAVLLALRGGGSLPSRSAWTALPALAAALLVPSGCFVELPWALLQVRIGIDATGRIFLLFTSHHWLLSTLDASSSMTAKPRQRAFFCFTLLAMSGNFGLIAAQDLFTFYLSFALMSFSSYGLVVHYRSEEAFRAGRIFIILVVFGEVLVFTALALIHQATGSAFLSAVPGMEPDPWTLSLLFLGFGIKVGALPLHVWLPLAHPAAPTPSSAVLSGAMIKAGLLGWLRFLPLGGAFLSDWGVLFVGTGLLAALGGVGVGLTQRNLKTVLAYSSISQMGLMTAGVGLALLLPERVPEAVAAVAVTACHHGLTKGALFLGVGMIDLVPRRSRERLWLHVGLGWCALALAGFPLTGGFLAKGLIKDVAVLLPPPWNDLVSLFLPLTAGGTALLMLHFLSLAIRSPGSGGTGAGRWLSWHAILGCVVVVAWMLPESAAGKASALDAARWWAAFWPAALALLTTLGFQALRRATGRSLSVAVPPGDILAIMGLLQRPLAKIRSVAGAVTAVLDRGVALCLLECWNDCFGGFTRLAVKWQLGVLEEGLMRFAVAGTLMVVALVILLLLLWQLPVPTEWPS